MTLNELIRATKIARNALLDLENLSEAEIEKLREEFRLIAERKRVKHSSKAKQQA